MSAPYIDIDGGETLVSGEELVDDRSESGKRMRDRINTLSLASVDNKLTTLQR